MYNRAGMAKMLFTALTRRLSKRLLIFYKLSIARKFTDWQIFE